MALKTFTPGEVLTAADVNTYLTNTLFARKTADESVASSATLQDDNELQVAVAANSIYELTAVFIYEADAAADFKWAFAGPAGTTFLGGHATHYGSGGTLQSDVFDGSDTSGGNGAGNLRTAHVSALVSIAGTSGTFKLTWAQSTADATATILKTASFILLRRVA